MDRFSTKRLLKKNLDYISGKTLDLGCGRGKYKELIITKASQYIGADFYEHKNVDVYTDARNTPFKNNEFETVICLQVLEHIAEPHKVIQECFRIVKNGGKVILTTVWLYPYHHEPDDYFRFSRKALEFMFTKVGFKIIKLESRGGRCRIISVFLRIWLKNKYLNKVFTNLFDYLDYIFNKKIDNLDTPSHIIIAQKP